MYHIDENIAQVTAVHRERYELASRYGEIYGRLKTREYREPGQSFPTVGDFVHFDYVPDGDSRILETLPRKTLFSRRDPTPGRGEQVVAANFDYVFILQSMNQNFNLRRLERYMTLSWQSRAIPVVVLTKADLAENPAQYLLEAEAVAAGAEIYAVSARTGFGLDDLQKYLQEDQTLVFLGSSGVGKSSLVNALAGENLMDTGDIRQEDGRGRHTTTHRQMLTLSTGTKIIDTPGMRELGMWDVSQGLSDAFTDVEQYLGQCRFRDCRHEREPGCAIRAAIEVGELSQERWDSYRKLKIEAEYAEDADRYLRQKREFFKELSKSQKQIKKNGKRRF